MSTSLLILASDYGNLVFMIGCVPTMIVALLMGLTGVALRARGLCVFSGSVTLTAAAVLALSYDAARSEDKGLTLAMAVIGGLLGGALFLVRPRSPKV